jgi:protein transport protein SEC24
MVATATRTILESLDRLPNEDDRTKVAIIAFDTSLYFFSITVSSSDDESYPCRMTNCFPKPGSTDSSMLVVSDIDDVFLPKPCDILVNVTEVRPALESLLGRINEMFQDNHIIGSALGPALNAGFKLMVCCYPLFSMNSFGSSRNRLTSVVKL